MAQAEEAVMGMGHQVDMGVEGEVMVRAVTDLHISIRARMGRDLIRHLRRRRHRDMGPRLARQVQMVDRRVWMECIRFHRDRAQARDR